jgi:hypothetical protein
MMDKWTAYLIIALSKADKELLKRIRTEFEAVAQGQKDEMTPIPREGSYPGREENGHSC